MKIQVCDNPPHSVGLLFIHLNICKGLNVFLNYSKLVPRGLSHEDTSLR